jgi:hypothetical protein
MIKAEVSFDEAKKAIVQANGFVRKAIGMAARK